MFVHRTTSNVTSDLDVQQSRVAGMIFVDGVCKRWVFRWCFNLCTSIISRDILCCRISV